MTWTTAPASRSASGTTLRPRLRSTKNSGREPEGNPDHVLDLLGRHAEVVGDLGEAIAGPESVDEIRNPRPAVDHQRLAERLARAAADLCTLVRRQPEALGPAVVRVGDALEVVADDLREVLLARADDGEQL